MILITKSIFVNKDIFKKLPFRCKKSSPQMFTQSQLKIFSIRKNQNPLKTLSKKDVFYMKTYFSKNYISETSQMETVNKSAWLSQRILENQGVLTAPKAMTQDELAEFLDQDYVASLFNLTLKYSALDVGWNSDLLKSITHSNGGVRDAVLSAIEDGYAGSLSSGLHHAGKNYGQGFCQVNGLAIAALIAKQKGQRIGILDVDAHFGGGTYNILGHLDIPIADLSTSAFDTWSSDRSIHHVEFYHDTDKQAGYLNRVQKALNHL
jgi:acetoin utilization deacetylase AcuC-like enzyme